ncbi:hypothetical protein Bbelb_418350 [Branchiostoma belcheri]|nr:hypothetical protein Bbelb_418350 [Branchiostoma belcheri]
MTSTFGRPPTRELSPLRMHFNVDMGTSDGTRNLRRPHACRYLASDVYMQVRQTTTKTRHFHRDGEYIYAGALPLRCCKRWSGRRFVNVTKQSKVLASDHPSFTKGFKSAACRSGLAGDYVTVTSRPNLTCDCDEPARDLTAARPNCKSRSAPYHTPHGSRRATDRAPDGSLTETGRKSL